MAITSKQRKAIKFKLEKIGLDKTTVKFFTDAVDLCIKRKIHIFDINMKSVIYPYFIDKYSKLGLKDYIRKDLNRVWKDIDHNDIEKTLKYNGKITPKKLLVALLMDL